MVKSFTLIELLIVITVIAVFVVSSIATYNNFTEEKKLDAETKKLVDTLELAKKKSLTSDLSGYSLCSPFGGYRVVLNNNNYILQICCSLDCTSHEVLHTYIFPTNIVSDSNENILFKPQSTALSQSWSLKIRNNNINKCFLIDINLSGLTDIGNEFGGAPCTL